MSSGQQLYGKIKDLIYVKDNPHYASYDKAEKVLYFVEQTVSAIRSTYTTLKGREVAEYTVSDLSDSLELLYAEYIEPIDLPMNNFAERFVDAQIPKFIEPALVALQAKLQQRED